MVLHSNTTSMFCCLKSARLLIWTPSKNIFFTAQDVDVFVREQVKSIRGFLFLRMPTLVVDEYTTITLTYSN